jgi:aerobic-type carbon monoxide dehydrogenase small subunit (CoxS/CutS family)
MVKHLATMKQTFKILVNESVREVRCEPDRTLLDVLREDLRLTGTKRGCDIGVCGTCTVLIDGKVKRACKVRVSDVSETRRSRSLTRHSRSFPSSHVADLKSIETIEGLEKDGKIHPIQQAFIDCGAIQCGFCTPGMVMASKALIDSNPNPTRQEIKKALIGNLCRCTGYQQIFDAVETAAKRMRTT